MNLFDGITKDAVHLVGCSAKKKQTATQAADLYEGDLFKKTVALLRQRTVKGVRPMGNTDRCSYCGDYEICCECPPNIGRATTFTQLCEVLREFRKEIKIPPKMSSEEAELKLLEWLLERKGWKKEQIVRAEGCERGGSTDE